MNFVLYILFILCYNLYRYVAKGFVQMLKNCGYVLLFTSGIAFFYINYSYIRSTNDYNLCSVQNNCASWVVWFKDVVLRSWRENNLQVFETQC